MASTIRPDLHDHTQHLPDLKRADGQTPEALAQLISCTVRQFGVAGCLHPTRRPAGIFKVVAGGRRSGACISAPRLFALSLLEAC